jgi:peptide/nickel transport system permease protein
MKIQSNWLIKKYGFDKPIATQYLYYINDLSPLSLTVKNESDYTYLSEGKYNAAPYSVSI